MVSHVVYLSIWSGLFFVAVVLLRDQLPIPSWLRNPVVMFGGVYGVLTPLDAFRQSLRHFIERAFQIRSTAWDALTEGRAARLTHLQRPEQIARTAVELAAEGTPNAGIGLFLGGQNATRLAYADGPGAMRDVGVAAECLRIFSAHEVVDLTASTPSSPTCWRSGVTRQLVEAGGLLDVPVFDHVIVGGDRYVSFAEAGQL